ncbi:trypsin inhibitor-like [Sitophilus oryzae]|uniref:Trypsin inhibitor-like n=1 Tax=Sitophilus oryzae TaxID=7048 RepID=A0A6J2Y1Z5_SITOR|nr:trypsin inhibitor-like [Sitophilus oryzae]
MQTSTFTIFVVLLLCAVCSGGVLKPVFTKSDCNLPHEEGPIHCLAYIPVFKWDNAKKQCVPAVYGGCRRTNNNFPTLEQCELAARSVCVSNAI